MIEAGILDGDIVVVHSQEQAENGDIVVALIDDEATLKRIFYEDGHVRLQPENHAMAPIIVDHADVRGKLVALVRRFEDRFSPNAPLPHGVGKAGRCLPVCLQRNEALLQKPGDGAFHAQAAMGVCQRALQIADVGRADRRVGARSMDAPDTNVPPP